MKQVLLGLVVLLLFACKNKENTTEGTNSSDSTDQTSTPAKGESGNQSFTLEKIWETEGILTTSEGVVFDEKRGVYYVSCIGGVPPTNEDGDGFIAILDQKGSVLDNAFVKGLDAPKGMVVHEDKIYVTDINEFVIIDINTKGMQRMALEGAQFLNDVALAPDGSIYFTDTNTNTIYKYSNDKVEVYLQDPNLANPNGIYVDDETIYLASFSAGDVNTVDLATKVITTRAKAAIPGGDGVIPWKGGFFISNWNGEVYYTNANWASDKVLDTKEAKLNAADIAINSKAGEVLVPTFFGNTVAAYKIVNKG